MTLDTAIKIAAFVLGVVCTAIVQYLFRRYGERPRPYVKLSDISITPSDESRKAKIQPDYLLTIQIDNNPVLPQLKSELTVETAKQYEDESNHNIGIHSDILGFLRTKLDQTHILNNTIASDKQRTEILRAWSSYGSMIDNMAKMALYNFESELPPIYRQPHPDDWKSGPKTMVDIGPNTNYALFELDVGAYAASVANEKGPQYEAAARRKAEFDNIYRRFWIHLKEDDLRWLFTRAHEIGTMLDTQAREALAQIHDLVKASTPEFLRVQALVSNDGSRACAVKPMAYLRIPNISAGKKAAALIPLLPEIPAGTTPPPLPVKANDSKLITLTSEVPVAKLEIKDRNGNVLLDANRLTAIFESQALECQLALSLTGFGQAATPLIVSESFAFGVQARTRTKEDLADALETQTS